jgi:hypothetical protein
MAEGACKSSLQDELPRGLSALNGNRTRLGGRGGIPRRGSGNEATRRAEQRTHRGKGWSRRERRGQEKLRPRGSCVKMEVGEGEGGEEERNNSSSSTKMWEASRTRTGLFCGGAAGAHRRGPLGGTLQQRSTARRPPRAHAATEIYAYGMRRARSKYICIYICTVSMR